MLFFNNKIKIVPEEILKLKKLKHFDLGGNLLEKNPSAKEICIACPLLQILILKDEPWQRSTQDSLEICLPELMSVRKKVKLELGLPDSQNI